MIPGTVQQFFAKNAQRTHAQTAQLLLMSDDELHTWIRRQAPSAAPKIIRKRGKGTERVKRLYDHDAVVIFRFAYALHLHRWPPSVAIEFAIPIHDELVRNIVRPMIADGSSNHDIRQRLNETIAVIITRAPGAPRAIHVLSTSEFAGLDYLSYEPIVTSFACGRQLLALIDGAAEQDRMAEAAALQKSTRNKRSS